MRKIIIALGALIAGLALAFGGATTATAHSEFEGSNPSQGSTTSSVTEIELTFGEAVVPDYSTVVLTDSTGTAVELASATYDTTATVMTLPIVSGALPNGDYVAGFRIVSVDGHPIAGEVDFTVAGSDAPALVAPAAIDDADTSADAATEDASGTSETVTAISAQEEGPSLLVVVGSIAAALVALGLVTVVLLVAIRRNRAKPTD
jgi:methionine-rich copper-binding protein CopC